MSVPTSLTKQLLQLHHPDQKISNEAVELSSEFLKLFIIEDAEFAERGLYFADVNRIPESIGKCQYVIFAEKLTDKLLRFKDTFMYNAQTVK